MLSCPKIILSEINDNTCIHVKNDDECLDIVSMLDTCKESVGQHQKLWDRAKKLGNPYEYVSCTAVTKEVVVSRSFFKLWEILMEFDLLKDNVEGIRPIYTLSVAEGPGGFIQCINHFRDRFHSSVAKKDSYTGFTLRSLDSSTPGWSIPTREMDANRLSLIYGSDNTGNLYSASNIRGLATSFPHTIDLFTADGGFDFSADDHHQETACIRLLCAQVLTCIETQALGGTAVIKMFDAQSNSTRRVLLALVRNFRTVIATKPHTSRVANSERYLICTGYTGENVVVESKLLWKCIFYNPIKQLEDPIQILQMSDSYLSTIRRMNTIFVTSQLHSLVQLLSICNWRDEWSEDAFIRMQQSLCRAWCRRYNLE